MLWYRSTWSGARLVGSSNEMPWLTALTVTPIAGAIGGENSDANVFGLQAGLKFPLLGGETVLAANYYECGACQSRAASAHVSV